MRHVGVGFSLEPETSLEVIASLLFAVVGISVYATLVGQVRRASIAGNVYC